MALLLDDRGAGALEAAARKADGGAYRAILGPIGKRIEKKSTLQRSGNSQNAASRLGRRIVTDGSVSMEAQGIMPWPFCRREETGRAEVFPRLNRR
jgi:hypothetical protein